jgi:hypothetical protein
MDMTEVEGMDIVKKQDHPTNHRLEEECMNMMGSNMVEVDDMDTVKEHFSSDEPQIEGGGYEYDGY